MAKKSQNKSKSNSSLANLLKDLATPAPKDFDPEDVHFRDTSKSKGNGEDSDDSEGYDSEAGREHYIEVGKSHLRDQLNLPIADDPKYRGSKSSRSAIYDESDIEDSEVEDESDIENSEIENDEGISDDNSQSVGEDEEISENSAELESSAESELNSQDDSDNDLSDQNSLAAELREAEEEEKKLLSELAKKATTDATKGHHVKKQLSLWESTLDLRIRFQKLVTLTYPLPQNDEHLREALLSADSDLMNSASAKLVNLIDDLLKIRQSLWPKSSDDTSLPLPKPVTLPSKRPRESDLDLDEIWKDISKVSESSSNYCKGTLEKWSNKVRMSEGSLSKGKKFKAIDQSFLHQVQSALADKDRVLRRSQLKRSEYKVIGQVEPESKSTEDDNNIDPEIYDDGDFYQQLLREFIESRMVDNDNQAELGGMRWAALKKDKQHKSKTVDTRASKGRKLRYHVHEPLQSFMAPIPTQMWHSEMIDELYSSLFQTSASVSKEPVDEFEIPNDGLRIFG